MAKIHDIRNAFFNEGASISEIAKDYAIDRKTVRKYIERDDWSDEEKAPCACREGILSAFKPNFFPSI